METITSGEYLISEEGLSLTSVSVFFHHPFQTIQGEIPSMKITNPLLLSER